MFTWAAWINWPNVSKKFLSVGKSQPALDIPMLVVCRRSFQTSMLAGSLLRGMCAMRVRVRSEDMDQVI